MGGARAALQPKSWVISGLGFCSLETLNLEVTGWAEVADPRASSVLGSPTSLDHFGGTTPPSPPWNAQCDELQIHRGVRERRIKTTRVQGKACSMGNDQAGKDGNRSRSGSREWR